MNILIWIKRTTRIGEGRTCLPWYPEPNKNFDWLVTGASLWMLAGLFLDGWAHNNLATELETFFTPWHAVLYSGFALAALVLGITYLANLRQGYHWFRALPLTYMLSLLGVIIFGLAGNLDFLWHAVFGFEEGVEALLSPSHLALASGGILITSSAVRSSLKNAKDDRNVGLSALFSWFIVVAVIMFFTQFANLYAHPHVFSAPPTQADSHFWDVTLIAYVLFPTAILMGAALFSLRHWDLPVGGLALLFSGNSFLMFFVNLDDASPHWPILIGGLASGLLAEALYRTLRPAERGAHTQHVFAFLLATTYALFPLVSLLATRAMWWSIHMWLGISVLAGFLGLGLSTLSQPHPEPQKIENRPEFKRAKGARDDRTTNEIIETQYPAGI